MKKILILLLFPFALYSQIVFVDQNATGLNDGSDWENAYTDLQTAIANIGTNTTINIAQGVYYTTTSTDRTISFVVPSGVKMYAGYPTGGGERDAKLYPTVLSGDINVVDDNTDNAFHVVTFTNTNSNTEIDGFIIEKGYANGSGSKESNGGGILVSTVDYGDSNAFIKNCIIRNNHAVGEGGGLFVYKRVEIYNCLIYSNTSDNSGGGLSIKTNGRIYNSFILNNRSVNFGGGIKITGFNNAPKAINCVIANNESVYGAGAYLSSGDLCNCTIVNNGGNGVHFGSYGNIYNSIVWQNSTYQMTHLESNNSHVIKNNIIQDISSNATNIGISAINDSSMLGVNYPRFVKPTNFSGNAKTAEELEEILNSNWTVKPESAAIDFGDNSTYPTTSNTPTIDINGNNRIINSVMDAGAFEALVNLKTKHASNLLSSSATLEGDVLFAETNSTVERGFVYSKDSDFDIESATSVTNATSGIGMFTEDIADLTENDYYYYRAWMMIDGVKYYGSEKKFNTRNLVAHYPFDGNAYDESGNGNIGVVEGATLTADRFGKEESAYSFDGNGKIDVASSNTLNIENELTISVWIKLSSFPLNDVIIVGKSNYYTKTNYILRLRGDGRLQFEYKISSYTSNTPIILDEWNHLGVVYNADGVAKIFINGEEATISDQGNSPSGLVVSPLTIGYSSRGAEYFNGSIDDVMIFDKALSSDDISKIFNPQALGMFVLKEKNLDDFYISDNVLIFRDTQDLNSVKNISVFNMLGQKVFETKVIIGRIEFSSLAKGTYMLKIDSDDGQAEKKKFIIQ
jgi:hypothetical protein